MVERSADLLQPADRLLLRHAFASDRGPGGPCRGVAGRRGRVTQTKRVRRRSRRAGGARKRRRSAGNFAREPAGSVRWAGMRARQDASLTIVTGVPRSGTSLVMQMLAAGGHPIASDGVRRADADNPRGYFELEAARGLARDASWLPGMAGRAVKLVHTLLPSLPPGLHYKVLLVRRRLDEVLASQRVMLARRGSAPDPAEDARLRPALEEQLARTRALAGGAGAARLAPGRPRRAARRARSGGRAHRRLPRRRTRRRRDGGLRRPGAPPAASRWQASDLVASRGLEVARDQLAHPRGQRVDRFVGEGFGRHLVEDRDPDRVSALQHETPLGQRVGGAVEDDRQDRRARRLAPARRRRS